MMIDTFIDRVYTGPVREGIERQVRGRLRLTRLELTSGLSDEGPWVATITAGFESMLSAMVDVALGRDEHRDYSHERGPVPLSVEWQRAVVNERVRRDRWDACIRVTNPVNGRSMVLFKLDV